MAATLHGLPDELLLIVLRKISPFEHLCTTRLVNRHFRSCIHDVICKELLPTLQVQLNVYVKAHYVDGEHLPDLNVELRFEPGDSSPGSEMAIFHVTGAEPSSALPKAIEAWKAAQSHGADGMLLRACLPGKNVVFIRGREWQRFSSVTARNDLNLLLNWRKLLLKYLGQVEKLMRASRSGPQFPLY
ncbi:Putative F-box domain-containing protein [Septoria linicola]|uniref:F-box domain-containing protein n=1 Tax=Septoria linicola TaxID=215465 RepID=A0A9Q9B4C5_9PEZI|nr:Putative F-box domain-containing protein [Septoria linicola]